MWIFLLLSFGNPLVSGFPHCPSPVSRDYPPGFRGLICDSAMTLAGCLEAFFDLNTDQDPHGLCSAF